MQQLSPETKIKIDNFINEVLSKKDSVDTEDFETKPSLIVAYLEKCGFSESDSDFDSESVYLLFSKENPNYYDDDYKDDDDYNVEEDDYESEEPEYFYIRIVINHLEYKCCLVIEY